MGCFYLKGCDMNEIVNSRKVGVKHVVLKNVADFSGFTRIIL